MLLAHRVTSLYSVGWPAVLIRAVLYALAITALVIGAPSEEQVFIYQSF